MPGSYFYDWKVSFEFYIRFLLTLSTLARHYTLIETTVLPGQGASEPGASDEAPMRTVAPAHWPLCKSSGVQVICTIGNGRSDCE